MSWFEFSPRFPGTSRAPVAALTGLALGLALCLAGCGGFGQGARNALTNRSILYKSEVVQGNFVSREQAAQLQSGMTRVQARDLLGTPLITPLFKGDRWDYVFTMNRQGVPPQNYRLTLYFADDVLDHFEGGNNLPSDNEFVNRISGHTSKGKVPPLKATPEQLKQFAAANPAPAASASDDAASAAAPNTAYPPLEE